MREIMVPLLLLLFLSTCHSANVLVIAGMRGSHFYVSTDIAEKIAGFGHNVTVLAMFSDDRVGMDDKPYNLIPMVDDTEADASMKQFRDVFAHFRHKPSVDMMVEVIEAEVTVDVVKAWVDDYHVSAVKYFKGEQFSGLLDHGNFELIVMEDGMTVVAMSQLLHRDIRIPTIGVVCIAGAGDMNNRYGLPGLINSVPSLTNDVTDSSPTFWERWRTLTNIVRLFKACMALIQPIFMNEPPEINVEDTFLAAYDIVFVNDHPAFSFPFLSPPNTFYLGFFNLEGRPLNPLPEDYLEFLAKCPYKHTVFFSFGSYLPDITIFSGTPAILKTLLQMDACVIIKSKVDLSVKFDLPADKFIQRAWIPQKDLLGSGKLDFFISHCGNNGRMEAIYYNVPLFCIPLFGDQYLNGRLVQRNKLGFLLTWETVTEESVTEIIDKLLSEKESIVDNMKGAVEIARNDPGAGTEVLRFYTDLLIKNGNADFLVNRIILNQSSVEIYNLDIAGLALTVIVIIILGILFSSVKCFKFCYQKILRKMKTD
ncbi:UDP-glucuronosyltransferase 2B16-like [Bolinopsis microptera]|uniref:UDP-glucuronosyltransferase 2B16-like n=1 Tax=Bolinopsis microptera TaxID=2820187 RepID=UPI00307AB64C